MLNILLLQNRIHAAEATKTDRRNNTCSPSNSRSIRLISRWCGSHRCRSHNWNCGKFPDLKYIGWNGLFESCLTERRHTRPASDYLRSRLRDNRNIIFGRWGRLFWRKRLGMDSGDNCFHNQHRTEHRTNRVRFILQHSWPNYWNPHTLLSDQATRESLLRQRFANGRRSNAISADGLDELHANGQHRIHGIRVNHGSGGEVLQELWRKHSWGSDALSKLWGQRLRSKPPFRKFHSLSFSPPGYPHFASWILSFAK